MPSFAKILARMLPLLDLSILLLGLFVILLTFTKFNQVQPQERDSVLREYVQKSILGEFQVFCVFAACPGDKGYEAEHYYRMSANFERGDQLSVAEIQKYVEKNKPNKTIVCIVTSKGVWDKWVNEKSMKELKGNLENMEVVHFQNIDFAK